MFVHIFTNRFKLLLRDRADLFWSTLYPIILSLFFLMAFSNLASAESFSSFPVGVVDNAEYRSQPYFTQALAAVSDEAGGEDKLFDVSLLSEEQAKEALDENRIAGYILFDNGAHVVVKSADIQQTILKSFVDSYLQQTSAVTSIIAENPSVVSRLDTDHTQIPIEEVSAGKSGADQSVIMYYGLISMAVMFGGFWGRREVEDIQADLSPLGARLGLTPVHKLKAFTSSMLASIVLNVVSLFVLVAFMWLVLGIDFGSQLGSIALFCVAAGYMGVAFGAFIASVVRGSDGVRLGVLLAVSLGSSTIAGMVHPNIKYAVTHAVPVLQYINPANLVSDALYALYYYGGGGRFALNMLLMLAFSAIFTVVVFFVTRRQKYASI
jgi:ABC-2 type transport system permease protein